MFRLITSDHTRHNTVRTSIAITVKLRASQMSSIEINSEKLVVLSRIESFASPNRIVFFFGELHITSLHSVTDVNVSE